jgi:uncharacterized protein YbjT (DUF2867 family)
MSSFVVAGATGRVGSVVAGDLLDRGHDVTVVVRDAARGERWIERGATVAVGTLGDAPFLTGVLRDADGFFALLPEDPAARDFHGARRHIADAIAAAVQASGVPHVLLLSAIAASLPEGNGPAKGLHYLENVLRNACERLTVVRACWLQENVGAALQPATHAGIYPNFMPSADIPFPTIATRDVGHIVADLLEDGSAAGQVIDLVGPMYSVRGISDALGVALGRPLQVVDIPADAHVETLVQAGLSPSFAEAVAELYACFAAGRVRPAGHRSLAGSTTLEELLPTLLAANR